MVARIVRTDVTVTVTATEMTVGIVKTIGTETGTMETMGMKQLASRATATV